MGLNEFKKNLIEKNEYKSHDSLNIINELKTNEFIKYYKDNYKNFKKEISFNINKQNALFWFIGVTEKDNVDIIFEDGIMFLGIGISHKGIITFDKWPLIIH